MDEPHAARTEQDSATNGAELQAKFQALKAEVEALKEQQDAEAEDRYKEAYETGFEDGKREAAQELGETAEANKQAIQKLRAQIRALKHKQIHGKMARKQLVLDEALYQARNQKNGKGRLLVQDAQAALGDAVSLSDRSLRNYFSELAENHRGIEYKQATSPKYLGRNVKALYLDLETFWTHHDDAELSL